MSFCCEPDESQVIVLIDDVDDEEVVKFHTDTSVTEKGQPHLSQQQQQQQQHAAIRSNMEIMAMRDICMARGEMEKYGYDVQRAVMASLPLDISDDDAVIKDEDGSHVPYCLDIAVHQPLLSNCNNRCESVNLMNQKVVPPAAAPFTDPEFLPNRSSLDGRLADDGDHDGDNQQSAVSRKPIHCSCGLTASAKTVQSEGPNYGRFYLACGKRKSRRQKRQRADENTDNERFNRNNDTFLRNPYLKSAHPPTWRIPKADNNKQPCNFFQWDTVDGSLGMMNSGYSSIGWSCRFVWRWFPPPLSRHFHCSSKPRQASLDVVVAAHVVGNNFSYFRPEHVRQGAVGNCWFLSALAVVAEHPYLLEQILGPPLHFKSCSNEEVEESSKNQPLDESGCFFQINLCLDGKWTLVVVDSHLPVVMLDDEPTQLTKAAPIHYPRQQGKRGHCDHIMLESQQSSHDDGPRKQCCRLAFCDVPDNGKLLWPALIEKAYAKAHGCYANLSGGFIAEAFSDLTGAPTETIVFDQMITKSHSNNPPLDDGKNELWARLLSFSEAGFLMGVATSSQGGDGLVGGHAYSVLDVLEFYDCLVGKQQKVTDFFVNSNRMIKTTTNDDNDVGCLELSPNYRQDFRYNSLLPSSSSNEQRTTVRLVRIRNPWGRREWKGAWSADDNERWTRALRKRLSDSYRKGDGTFFMSFDDLVDRFHHMDVAKCRKGWLHRSIDGCFRRTNEPMRTSQFTYRIESAVKTWAFISLIQPKKRANTKTSYWYSDPSFILLKRPKASNDPWSCEACNLQGVARTSDMEVFLDLVYEYCCVPFSYCLCQPVSPFRISTYTSAPIMIEQLANKNVIIWEAAILCLHKQILQMEPKLVYAIARKSLLLCVHGKGCLYFLAINGNYDYFLSLRMTLNLKAGVIAAFGGESGDTHDVPPRSQRILVVLSRDGKNFTSTDISFQYISGLIPSTRRSFSDEMNERQSFVGLGASFPLTMAGDLLTSGIECAGMSQRGGDNIDIFCCVAQVGTAA